MYRIHADRAQELTGGRINSALAARGVEVTNTAGHESDANERAERAVQSLQEKAMTLCSAMIRSGVFQKQLKLWTFAGLHSGELHRRDAFGEPPCKFEFGQRALAKQSRR